MRFHDFFFYKYVLRFMFASQRIKDSRGVVKTIDLLGAPWERVMFGLQVIGISSMVNMPRFWTVKIS